MIAFLAAFVRSVGLQQQLQIKLCGENNIPFLATGGGHGYSTSFGKLQNGLELDLGGFRNITVDKAASTLTVGGAVTFGDVYEPLYNAGKEIRKSLLEQSSCRGVTNDCEETGSCTCVGFVGGTLGGGVGRYQGIHGLISDSLLSVQLVTAAGQLITVSANENSDLFWGIRGAGMNYGVILEATYEVYDLTNGGDVQVVDFIFTKDQNESYFQTLASLQGTLPPEMALLSYVDFNSSHGGTVVLLDISYPGPVENFTELIKPFTDLNPAYQQIQNNVPWSIFLTQLGFHLDLPVCDKGQLHSMYSVATKNLSWPDYVYAFSQFDQLFTQYPETIGSTLEVEFFPNQAVLAQPYDSSAYAFRDVNAQVMIQMDFSGSATGPAANAANQLAQELRPRFQATSGYPELEIYVSYAHGDEQPENWYGKDKLPRLVQLKQQWDPQNLFQYDNPVPLQYP